jgi:NAD(P)-dependent dehydrogenase (short-subunit alcohol dehydrogenase family)
METKGQAAIVTGGASGLGAACARALAAAGAKVAIIDVNEKAAAEVADSIKGIAIACDVADSASGEAAVKKAAAAHGPARILVNCAGVGPAKRIVGREGPMPLADYERVIRINLIGTFNMMRLVAGALQTVEPLAGGERGIRRPDRTGRLLFLQGRRCCAHIAGRARICAVRDSRPGDRTWNFWYANAARAAPGNAGLARRLGTVSQTTG